MRCVSIPQSTDESDEEKESTDVLKRMVYTARELARQSNAAAAVLLCWSSEVTLAPFRNALTELGYVHSVHCLIWQVQNNAVFVPMYTCVDQLVQCTSWFCSYL